MGAMGVFVPFATREEVEFFQMLEAHLRNEIPYSLVGRDHTSYRSYYAPVKVRPHVVMCAGDYVDDGCVWCVYDRERV